MATVMERPKAEKQLVEYRAEGGIAIVELCDPPANAYSLGMMRELDEAIVRARFDDDVHVIVLRGGGERFFSAGANIRMMQRETPRFLYYFSLYANETLSRLEHTPKLTIAALNGHAVGGGLEVALACDLRIAKADGGKIGLPEVNLRDRAHGEGRDLLVHPRQGARPGQRGVPRELVLGADAPLRPAVLSAAQGE